MDLFGIHKIQFVVNSDSERGDNLAHRTLNMFTDPMKICSYI